MRELNEFDSWAQDIVESSIMERDAPEQKAIKRAIPQSQDVMFQAQRKYRDLSPEDALSKFLSDKLEDFDRRDLDQNKVINRQRQENEKLRSQVSQMSQELQDLETHSAQSDAEINRLRDLSGSLRADVEKRRVSGQEVQDILAQVDAIKNKAGISPEQYQRLKTEVEKQIEDFKTKGVNPEKFQELQQRLDVISSSNKIGSDDVERVENLLKQVEAGQRETEMSRTDVIAKLKELEKGQADLEQREKNIDKEIDKKVIDAAVRAGRRGTQAEYKRSKARLDYLENETIQKINAKIEDIEHHDAVQDVEIANLSGQKPTVKKNVAAEPVRSELDQFMHSLYSRAKQQQSVLAKNNNTNIQKQPEQPEMQPEPENPEKEKAGGLNVVPMKTNESIQQEAYKSQEEEDREKAKVAAHYAGIYAPLYYEIFEKEPDKRRVMRRYAKDSVIDALYYSIYNWLFRIGRYAVEDEERLWRTALEILVAQHPYVEYDDLGLDPKKIRRGSWFQAPPPRTKQPSGQETQQQTGTKPREPGQPPGPDDVSESRLPHGLSQQIDTLAENILGEQYSKYLR
jgi:hypothetical protein